MLTAALLSQAAGADGDPIYWAELGIQPGFDLGPLTLRYYALAYVIGILLAYWHLVRMSRAAGSPMTAEQVADLVLASTLGIIVGGRLGYATFYDPQLWTSLDLLKLWEGGMSFHGGVIGVVVAMALFARKAGLPFLRVADYLVVGVPFGIMFGRIANFINGELWGRPSSVPWAMVFPGGGPEARHPSQLYEAALEGAVMIVVMLVLFWRTSARWRPGLLAGAFVGGIGVARFIVEFFREPDAQLAEFAERTGLNMGQWLTIPLIVLGALLIARAIRRPRVDAAEVEGDDASGAKSDPEPEADDSSDPA